MKHQLRTPFVMVTAVLIVAGCSNVKDTSEYKALTSEVSQLQNDVTAAKNSLSASEKELKSITSVSNTATTKLKKLQDTGEANLTKISQALETDAIRSQALQKFALPACSAAEKAFHEAGVVTDDDSDVAKFIAKKIGASKYAWWGATRSALDDDKYSGIRRFTAEFDAYREECQQTGSDAFFDTCKTFDKRFLKKDPESFKGKCIRGRVKVAQFEATSTGKCAFQGYLDNDYDFRAQFGVSLDPNTHQEQTDCSWTSEIVEDLTINFWAVGLGSFTYTTTNGNKLTVPAFKLLAAQR
jgi:hypothetical protein